LKVIERVTRLRRLPAPSPRRMLVRQGGIFVAVIALPLPFGVNLNRQRRS